MGHPAPGVCLVFDGWFQFNPHPVAVVAIALGVAHIAGLLALVDDLAMLRCEMGRVIEAMIRKGFILRIMTIRAEAIILTFFLRVLQRRCVTGLQGCAGQQGDQCQNQAYYKKNFFGLHFVFLNWYRDNNG